MGNLSLPNTGAFTQQDVLGISAALAAAGIMFTGTMYYLDPKNGLDTNNGLFPQAVPGQQGQGPVKTLGAAYALTAGGKNDVIVLISDGTTASTARVDAAFTWAKSSTHLIGVSSGVNLSNRSRIAPTSTTTAFANFFTVSGSGCLFSNVEWFDGFNTGTTAQIAMTISGGRNLFSNCHIAGMGDAASAADAGSRSLKITGTGENQFVNCTIGIDTQSRTNANASVEFAGGTPRNVFKNCLFPFDSGDGATLGVKAGAGGIDRFQLFDRCMFINAINSAGTAMTALGAISAPTSPAGMIVYHDCGLVGISEWEGTTKTSAYVIGPAVSSSMGIGVNPA